jgi:hypothetical protein
MPNARNTQRKDIHTKEFPHTHTTRNDALANAYIWLQYGDFGCNWNHLLLSFLVDKWLQLEWCNSLRQPFDVELQ